jgi:S1-C subfamily serine protease
VQPAASVSPGANTSDIDAQEQRTEEMIARLLESAVALEYSAADAPSGARRVASGIVISEEGDVLSVRIDPPSASSPVLARNASGRRLPAQWVAADPQTGLTLLKIAPKLARPAIPSPRGPRLGSLVLLIGNPFGLAHSVGRGSVSGLNRRVELGSRQLGGLIQVDAALHPGDSGALLADLHGGWLGVIRSGLAAPSEKEKDKEKRAREHDHDLGFAIPARDALWVADQLRTHKRVNRAYLGVTMLDPVPSDAPHAEPDGIVLASVLDDTPAGRSGLKSGDRLIALNDQPVRTPNDLTDRLDRIPADMDVTLDFLRGAGPAREHHRLTLRTTTRPLPDIEPIAKPSIASAPSPSSPKARSEEARPPLPREVADKIERLERRIDELEKRENANAVAPHNPQP